MRKLGPEASVKRAVEDLLKAEGIPVWRMHAGKIKSEFGGWIQLNAKGTADLLAAPDFHPHFQSSCLCPTWLWIEIKAPKGRLSTEQLQFADFVRNRGHQWLLVNNVKILQDWLREHRGL